MLNKWYQVKCISLVWLFDLTYFVYISLTVMITEAYLLIYIFSVNLFISTAPSTHDFPQCDTICWSFLCVAALISWLVLLKCFIGLVAYQRVTQQRVISITMDTSISIILPVEGQGGLKPADPSFWTMQNKTSILNGAAESHTGVDRWLNSLAPVGCDNNYKST